MIFLKIHSYPLVKMDVFKSFVQYLCNISYNKKIKEKILFKIYAYTERKPFNVRIWGFLFNIGTTFFYK